jgi:hypothetical protein
MMAGDTLEGPRWPQQPSLNGDGTACADLCIVCLQNFFIVSLIRGVFYALC